LRYSVDMKISKTSVFLAVVSVFLSAGVYVTDVNASSAPLMFSTASKSGLLSNGYNFCMGVNSSDSVVNVSCVSLPVWMSARSSRSAGFNLQINGKCLTAPSLTDGQDLSLRTCGSTPATQQDWLALSQGGIGLINSKFCLDVEVGVPKDGSPIQIYTCQELKYLSARIPVLSRIPAQNWVYDQAMFNPSQANVPAPQTTVDTQPPSVSAPSKPPATTPPSAGLAAASQPPTGGPDCDQNLRTRNYKRANIPKYIFIGVRGSGEKTTDTNPNRGSNKPTGMGTRMEFLYDQLRSSTKFNSIICTGPLAPFPLDSLNDQYPALEVPSFAEKDKVARYISDIAGNYIYIRMLIADLSVKYPKSKLILAGYSQGAAIVHAGVAAAVTRNPSVKSRIANVVLIADPLAEPNDKNIIPTGEAEGANWTKSLGVVTLVAAAFGRGEKRSIATITGFDLASKVLDNVATRNCPLAMCPVFVKIGKSLKVVVEGGIQLEANWQTAWADLRSSATLNNLGVSVLSVCKWGDAVCSPIAGAKRRSIRDPLLLRYPFLLLIPEFKPAWFNADTHSNAYTNNAGMANALISAMKP
jgi:hypothetical protein